jgi:hypothetical protein
MKQTVDGSFTKLDENLNLDPVERLTAQDLRGPVR